MRGDLPEHELLLAGPWSGAELEWLAREQKRLGIPGARHVGYVDEDALPSLYGNAAAFVFPSLAEGFGFPVLEAMACGAPVITSNRSSLPEVAGDAAVLVDPQDADALAVAMVAAAERLDPAQLERGFAQARRFTWAETARRTWEQLRLLER